MEDDSNAICVTEPKVPAAKIHVLGLAPLKKRLGPNWAYLSGLVHKLFDAALASAQNSSHQSILMVMWLDELSYAVVFQNLSIVEANRVCAAIASEVCKALFGGQVDEVSVRSIVSEIVMPFATETAQTGKLIEAMLERCGTESVYTQSVHSNSRELVVTVEGKTIKPPLPPRETIKATHALLAEHGLELGFFPVWDLRRNQSSRLFLMPFSTRVGTPTELNAQWPYNLDDEQIAVLEIELLDAAVAYRERVADCGKVCAVGVAVSYKSLTVFRSRIRYITALQKLQLRPSTPLVLRIGQIPIGAPAARIGELAAMMQLPNMRITLGFESLERLPEFDFRLSAIALGGTLNKGMDRETVSNIVRKLVHAATLHNAFAVLNKLDTSEFVEIAREGNVRCGTGAALSSRYFSGLERVPDFPLNMVE